ncbi:MAG: hypothetical protein ACI9QD_001229 [Thermoproteota archaeon]|jgi:hypothetical protein
MQRKNILKFIRNYKGQGVMEYLILTSLVGIFCLLAVKQFGSVIKTRIESMKKQITKSIAL